MDANVLTAGGSIGAPARMLGSLVAIVATVAVFSCAESPLGPLKNPTDVALSVTHTDSLHAGRSRAYRVALPASATVLVSLAASASAVTADVYVGGGATVDATIRASATTAFGDSIFAIPPSATPHEVVVLVTAAAGADRAVFALRTRTLTDGPEHQSATLAVGVATSERLDAPGDVDVFVLPAISAMTGRAFALRVRPYIAFADTLTVEVIDASGTRVARMRLASFESSLTSGAPVLFVPIAHGSLAVRVFSGAEGLGSGVGGYDVRVDVPQSLLLPQLSVGTTRTDSISATRWPMMYTFAWSPVSDLQLWVDPVGFTAADTLVAIVRAQQAPFDSIGAFTAVGGSGAVTFPVPRRPAASGSTSLRMFVRGQRESQGGSYQMSYQSSWSSLPEQAGEILSLDAPVSVERLEDPGDVDRFTIAATPASDAILFVSVDTAAAPALFLPGGGNHRLAIRVTDSTGATLDEFELASSDSLLWAHGRRLRFNAGGPVTLTVSTPGIVPWRYRLRALTINRQPEGVPATLAKADTVTEALDGLGDIDEYAIVGSAGDTISVRIAVPNTQTAPISFELVSGDNVILAAQTLGGQTNLDQLYWPGHVLAAPAFVRVLAPVGGDSAYNQSFQLEAYHIRSAPEILPATFILGASIDGETLERPGDLDIFRVALDSNTHFLGEFYSTRAHPTDSLKVSSESAAGTPFVLSGATSTDSVGMRGPMMFEGPGLGDIVVTGRATAQTPYRIDLRQMNFASEVIAKTFPFDTWVVGEALDYPGDVDRFEMSAALGERFVFEVDTLPGGTGPIQLNALNGYTYLGDRRPWSASYTGTHVGISSATDHPTPVATGPYRFRVTKVSLGTETADSALAFGDSVSTEWLDNPADADVFVVQAVAGVSMQLRWGPRDSIYAWVEVDVLQPDGQVIMNGFAGWPGGTFIITPTQTGPYRVRLQSLEWETQYGNFPAGNIAYWVTLKPAP